MTIHATCVAIGGDAVLLTGASGAGKSDLALRLIDRGAILVADDYTIVERDGAALTARPPATIAGRIEVRGIGIVARAWLDVAPVALIVELGAETERMPEPRSIALHGVPVSAVVVDPHRPSAPIKVEYALAHIRETRA